MLLDPNGLIDAFQEAATATGIPTVDIEHHQVLAPHKPPILPKTRAAIYVFSLSESYGQTCSAGSHRVIKVGMVGPNSGPRFQYQHYAVGSAMSTLAGAIVRTPVLWPFLGIARLDEAGAGEWLRQNTDRDNFFLPGDAAVTVVQLERYLKGRLGPVFEGMSASKIKTFAPYADTTQAVSPEDL